ncbi:unnamed protein product [Anisakis simplex]|uniref:Uncharacterized protein n=1 Tax=Anisakis simplex TaxID=6269 RepID=A0A0M3JIS5_ANISI|nr:unnamed protein product [Anisakis simplex]
MSAYRSDIVTQATDLRTNIYYLNAHRQLSNQPTATGNGDNESSSNNQKSANSLDEKAAKAHDSNGIDRADGSKPKPIGVPIALILRVQYCHEDTMFEQLSQCDMIV